MGIGKKGIRLKTTTLISVTHRIIQVNLNFKQYFDSMSYVIQTGSLNFKTDQYQIKNDAFWKRYFDPLYDSLGLCSRICDNETP